MQLSHTKSLKNPSDGIIDKILTKDEAGKVVEAAVNDLFKLVNRTIMMGQGLTSESQGKIVHKKVSKDDKTFKIKKPDLIELTAIYLQLMLDFKHDDDIGLRTDDEDVLFYEGKDENIDIQDFSSYSDVATVSPAKMAMWLFTTSTELSEEYPEIFSLNKKVFPDDPNSTKLNPIASHDEARSVVAKIKEIGQKYYPKPPKILSLTATRVVIDFPISQRKKDPLIAEKYSSRVLRVLTKNGKERWDTIKDVNKISFEYSDYQSNPRMQKRISLKIRKLVNEGYSPKQAAAIAYSMARKHTLGTRGGYVRKNPHGYQTYPAFKDSAIKVFWKISRAYFKKPMSLQRFKKAFKFHHNSVALFNPSSLKGISVNYTTGHYRSPNRKKDIAAVNRIEKELRAKLEKAFLDEFGESAKTLGASVGISNWSGHISVYFSIRSAYNRSHHESNPHKRKNPIEDKDVKDCLDALSGMIQVPDRCEDVEEHILKALESEGLWSYDTGVTEKGKKFLTDADWDESNESWDL